MKKAIGLGLAAGVIGVAVVLAGLHVYVDHRNWHQVVNAIAAQQAKAKPALPMAAPAPDPGK